MADSKLRLYGLPASLTPRTDLGERFELLVDEPSSAGRVRALERAVDLVFADGDAAAEFRADPHAFLAKAGVPELTVAWDSVELRMSRALGDPELRKAAATGDVAAFVDRLQSTGLIPATLDVGLKRAEALGFTPVTVFAALVVLFVAAWTQAAVAPSVAAAVVAAAAVAVATPVWAFVGGGPGGDNPDDSEDVSTLGVPNRSFNSMHVARLLNRYLNADLMSKLATYLHDQGFGDEVTSELVKRAILAVWRKATTGELPEPEREQLYMDIIQTLGRPELFEQAPELSGIARYAMLATGFATTALQLLVRLREPVRFVTLDFDPRALLTYQKTLILPTGSLYGLENAATFKARLEEYVRLGGTCICMSQQRGVDFGALPGKLGGYGWLEDQSCHAQSVAIDSAHPAFAGQQTLTLDISVDGFFTEWPKDATVLLRRTVNGQPAMLLYRYGAGRVLVTSAYADWGIGQSQLTESERLLMRDAFAWARLADEAVPEYDPSRTPFTIVFPVTNRSASDAARVVVNAIDPDKNVLEAHFVIDTPVPAQQTRQLTISSADMKALGHWSLDAVLQDAAGQPVDIRYDAATFLVDNFQASSGAIGYKGDPLALSAVVDSEQKLAGGTANVKLLLWNYSGAPLSVDVKTNLNHSINPETRSLSLPPGQGQELFYPFGPLEAGPYTFSAQVIGADGRLSATALKTFRAEEPAAELQISTDKEAYRPGEAINVGVQYLNTAGAAFAADLLVAVRGPDGAMLSTERTSIKLPAGVPGTHKISYSLPASATYGLHLVEAELQLNGRRIEYASTQFTPVLRGTVRGTVADAVSGAPLAGAKVALDGQPAQSAVAGAAGEFSFAVDAGANLVTAEMPGYAPASARTMVLPERTSTIDSLYLVPLSGRLEVAVLDRISNAPIAGARLESQGQLVGITGADGLLSLPLPAGRQDLDIRSAGYPDAEHLSVEIAAGRSVRAAPTYLAAALGRIDGTIRSGYSRAPLAGALIAAGDQKLKAGADGRFSLEVAPGQLEITVQAAEHVDGAAVVQAVAGRTLLLDDLLLAPAFADVSGTALDAATRQPIAGAMIKVGGAAVTTGADGRYHFHLQAGRITLDAHAAGHDDRSLSIALVPARSLDGIDLLLSPQAPPAAAAAAAPASFSGQILDAIDGKPLEGVSLTYADGAATFRTDRQGNFAINNFPTDLTEVFATLPGYRAPGDNGFLLALQIDVGQQWLGCLFLLPDKARLAGHVFDGVNGRPLEGVRLWLGDQLLGVETAADGYFALEGLKPGESIDIHAARDGYASSGGSDHLVTLQTVAGATARIDAFLLPKWGTLAGSVLDAVADVPIAGALVYTGEGELSAATNALGQFNLPMPEGRHDVFVEAAGYPVRDASAPLLQLTLPAGKTVECRLSLQPMQGSLAGRVLDAITQAPIASALVSTDEGLSPALTGSDGSYQLPARPGSHDVHVRALDYLGDGGAAIASATVVPGRAVRFNHLLRAAPQASSFVLTGVPDRLDLIAGQDQSTACRVRNTGKLEGGATLRLVIAGFLEQQSTIWLPAGAELPLAFNFRMPDDALTAAYQDVYFELEGGERRAVPASLTGASVTATAMLDKQAYAAGETATLKVMIRNAGGGPLLVFARAQLGESSQSSPIQLLTDALSLEFAVAIGAEAGKLFFGVYHATGRALLLDALYVPRAGDTVTLSSAQQIFRPNDTVAVQLALTDQGRAYLQGTAIKAQFRVAPAEGDAEVVPAFALPVPDSGPMTVSFILPGYLRQGTYLLHWMLAAGDKSLSGVYPIDVKGYKARFIDFGTDRSDYLRTDTIGLCGVVEVSNAVRCRLDFQLLDPAQGKLASTSQELELAAGQSKFSARLPLQTKRAGHHTLVYALSVPVPGGAPLALAAGQQGVEVAGPVLLGMDTDRKRYRPGDTVTAALTLRGEGLATVRFIWDDGAPALETNAVLSGVQTLNYRLMAPVSGAHRLRAELLAGTASSLSTAVLVRP